jgi:hypothetical protein
MQREILQAPTAGICDIYDVHAKLKLEVFIKTAQIMYFAL